MNDTGHTSYIERYEPWQPYTALQRRLLRVCAITVGILIMAATFEWCRVLVEWPAVTLGLRAPEPPLLWAVGGPVDLVLAYDTGSPFLNFALGEAVVYISTMAIVAVAYSVIVLARHWAQRVGV